ncbi:uncharacterized protein Dwil_GK11364 [Drosophila willistoni]|uniref:Nucleoside phosphorylase domain-containing protein n=1 Tax=Drosophila willistoni TaxID=7260 RepID=B4NAJ9_DROWI|nr:uridine phosphorylase 1 [Drosophila willistoni]EDW80813.2 uncharacterized protein Dwil_GK11364 [Drosophila willistoni]
MVEKKGRFRSKQKVMTSAPRRRNVSHLQGGVGLLTQQASQMSNNLFIARRSSGLMSGSLEDRQSGRNLVRLSNPRISQIKNDRLYHLGLDTSNTNMPNEFGEIKFVVIGESAGQMEEFARLLAKDISQSKVNNVENLARGGDSPYVMYKVEDVLILSHSLGAPSISILLNELIKLMHHAHCNSMTFIRIGQSGGVGVRPGTVIVSEQVFDAQLRNSHEVVVMGKPRLWPTKLDGQLAKELTEMNIPASDGFEAIAGHTMSTNDFYEGQFRLDGAFADYNEVDKQVFLSQLVEKGIRNIEMESTAFAAITHKANIRSAIVCVTNLNRLNGDTITATKEQLDAWDRRPQKLVSRYIQQNLNMPSSTTKVNFGPNSRNSQ